MIGHALDEDFSSAARMVVWMPSHGAAHTINVVKDSSGSLLTPVMWRANRLADLLAKSAAEPLRLPRRIAKYVAVMSKLDAHRCARLGVATHRANAHHVVVQDEEGVERIMILRDSTAERPQWKLRPRKPRAVAAAQTKRLDPAGASSQMPWPLETTVARCSSAEQRSGRSRKRQKSQVPRPQATKKAKLQAVEAIRQDVRDEEQLARWLRGYSARPSTAPPADERFAALRARVRLREQQAAECARWCGLD